MKRTLIVMIAGLVSFLFFPNPTAAERRGKEVIVRTMDAREIIGELIAVKADSLLLLRKSDGRDITIKVDAIDIVKVIRRARPYKGMLYGSISAFVVGGVFGALFPGDAEGIGTYIGGYAFTFAPFGAVAGAILSGLVAHDSTYLFKGRPSYFKEDILRKLRKHARIKDV